MNKDQDAKFSMYNAVRSHLQANPAALATVPALPEAVAAFSKKVADINLAAQQQEASTVNITDSKNSQKEALARQAVTIAGLVHAWATATGNAILKGDTDIKDYQIARLKDDKLAAVCTDIYNKAAAHQAEAQPYGLSAELLAGFGAAIAAYQSVASDPRKAISSRRTLTGNVKALFADADTLLRSNLDRTMRLLAATHPDFYNDYKANRRIVDAAGRRKTAMAPPVTPVLPQV